jgi:hypothetical protein
MHGCCPFRVIPLPPVPALRPAHPKFDYLQVFELRGGGWVKDNQKMASAFAEAAAEKQPRRAGLW